MPLTPAEKQKRYRARKSNASGNAVTPRSNAGNTPVTPAQSVQQGEGSDSLVGQGAGAVAAPSPVAVEDPVFSFDHLREAEARGRALGEDEADRRGETGATRAERVDRAGRYAIWDASGRPSKDFSGTRRGGEDPKP